MAQPTDREIALKHARSQSAKTLLDALLHGSCERSTAEQVLREKIDKAPELNPDWDKLEVTRESLRDHMRRLRTLIDGLQKITEQNSSCGTYNYVQKLCDEAQKA